MGLESLPRFELSQEDFARERMMRLREVIADLQYRHPEVMGITLYGSMTKGTAHPASDIDGWLWVDADAISSTRRGRPVVEFSMVSDSNRQDMLHFTFEEVTQEKYEKLVAYTFEKHGFKPQQEDPEERERSYDIWVMPMSGEIVDKFLKDYVASWRFSRGADRLGIPEGIASLFHLAMGRSPKPGMPAGIPRYRAMIIDKLSEAGPTGKSIWKKLIRQLAEYEQDTGQEGYKECAAARDYPWTLAQAKKVYGR